LLAFGAVQGVIVLALYAFMGPQTTPDDLPLGLQLDPLHGVIHLLSGLIGGYIGFWRPSAAVRFLQLFAVFYLLLAVFGTFTSIHFGLQIAPPENVLHWTLGLVAAAIGFGPLLVFAVRRG
jgi:vacuolar-type H+-ATPase subunit I/STV1